MNVRPEGLMLCSLSPVLEAGILVHVQCRYNLCRFFKLAQIQLYFQGQDLFKVNIKSFSKQYLEGLTILDIVTILNVY